MLYPMDRQVTVNMDLYHVDAVLSLCSAGCCQCGASWECNRLLIPPAGL
jgi:hypothetical protein